MKKVFCLTFVLLSAIGIFAQERVLEQAEFDAVMKKRFAKFYGQPHRQTTSFADVSKDSKRAISWKTVRETGAARRLRTLYEFDSPTIRTRQETIIVDGKIYTRKDGGEWTEKSLASEFGNRTVRDSKLKTVEEKTEYKSLGTQVVFDLTASVYEKIERKKLVNEENQTEMF